MLYLFAKSDISPIPGMALAEYPRMSVHLGLGALPCIEKVLHQRLVPAAHVALDKRRVVDVLVLQVERFSTTNNNGADRPADKGLVVGKITADIGGVREVRRSRLGIVLHLYVRTGAINRNDLVLKLWCKESHVPVCGKQNFLGPDTATIGVHNVVSSCCFSMQVTVV